MDMLYVFQVLLTFLLALFSIVPEFKANKSRNGENRTLKHRLILFLRKPTIRVISLILLIIAIASANDRISEKSENKVNDSIRVRDQRREQQTFRLQSAITEKLNTMGYQYDSINNTLVRLRDSIKRQPKMLTEKPLLASVFRIDSVDINKENIVAEVRMIGANAKDVMVFTSILAIHNSKPVLLYSKDKVLANRSSIAKDVVTLNFKFPINNISATTSYIIYLSGNYSDMNGVNYPVEDFILLPRVSRSGGNLPIEKVAEVKAFFTKGISFTY